MRAMKTKTIMFAAFAASLTISLPSFAAQVNADDPGGTSFDFAAISEKRFASAFDPSLSAPPPMTPSTSAATATWFTIRCP